MGHYGAAGQKPTAGFVEIFVSWVSGTCLCEVSESMRADWMVA